MIKRQITLLLTAMSFYTRLPVPAYIHQQHSAQLPDAIRYLPVIGWMVGIVSALVYVSGSYLFNMNVGLLLSFAAGVLMTGAFHEDGFADVCDGFGGGWSKPRILEIMKDSRLGTYGVTGLIIIFGLKFSILQLMLGGTFVAVKPWNIVLLFALAHSLSRFAAITVVFNHTYARIEESKASGAVEKGDFKNLLFAGAVTVLPLFLLSWESNNYFLFMAVIPALLVAVAAGNYFKKWIGGYTGDCLGAVQQLAEVVIYMSLILIWKFT
ncbi:adenosylcobinamide-GDP ribazoletransferase [Pedobacter sp. AW31-3R]|uniref:adenosylcobinamide-GDP ribazoletransferase n=1 Tax=Pedobacter sp. AW31-3R TaxID=3445781 RepID=UPI003FA0B2D1